MDLKCRLKNEDHLIRNVQNELRKKSQLKAPIAIDDVTF